MCQKEQQSYPYWGSIYVHVWMLKTHHLFMYDDTIICLFIEPMLVLPKHTQGYSLAVFTKWNSVISVDLCLPVFEKYLYLFITHWLHVLYMCLSAALRDSSDNLGPKNVLSVNVSTNILLLCPIDISNQSNLPNMIYKTTGFA